MMVAIGRTKTAVVLIGLFLLGGVLFDMAPMFGAPVRAGAASGTGTVTPQEGAERGRVIFNGRGMCSHCHGIDGHKDRLPPLSPNALKAIAGINPPPADLRNPAGLKLTTDQARFDAVRHGHMFTAMQPVSRQALTDDELLDLVAYLAALRGPEVPPAPAGPPARSAAPLGSAERGRDLYRSSGCAVCHGIDGDISQRPPVSAELAQKLARLDPPAANLRDPKSLKSEDDAHRFLTIKLGHPRTAMFPKKFLRDEDIRDVVAYLAVLRGE